MLTIFLVHVLQVNILCVSNLDSLCESICICNNSDIKMLLSINFHKKYVVTETYCIESLYLDVNIIVSS